MSDAPTALGAVGGLLFMPVDVHRNRPESLPVDDFKSQGGIWRL